MTSVTSILTLAKKKRNTFEVISDEPSNAFSRFFFSQRNLEAELEGGGLIPHPSGGEKSRGLSGRRLLVVFLSSIAALNLAITGIPPICLPFLFDYVSLRFKSASV